MTLAVASAASLERVVREIYGPPPDDIEVDLNFAGAAGAEVEPVIHLVFVAADGTDKALAHHPRTIIVAGEGSRATEAYVRPVEGAAVGGW